MKVLVAQSCPAVCYHMDYSLPGSSLHGILQASILEWVAIPFSRGSPQPRDWTQVSHIADRFFTIWATREVGYIFFKKKFFNIKRLWYVYEGRDLYFVHSYILGICKTASYKVVLNTCLLSYQRIDYLH